VMRRYDSILRGSLPFLIKEYVVDGEI